MKTLKIMAASTVLLITLLAGCSEPARSEPDASQKTPPTASTLVLEEQGYANGWSYSILRDEKSGIRIFTHNHHGTVILEKPQPLEGH